MPLPDEAAPQDRVLPRSLKECGCYVRMPDYEAVMCPDHAARRAAMRAAERERRHQDEAARVARLPWNGPGGGAIVPALVFALLAIVSASMGTAEVERRVAFDAGYETATADVLRYHDGWRGPSWVDVRFVTHEDAVVEADLEDYDGEAPEVGTTVDIDYAMSDPRIVRASGFDSNDAVDTAATMAGGSAAIALALLARVVTARARARRRA